MAHVQDGHRKICLFFHDHPIEMGHLWLPNFYQIEF